MKTKPAFYIGVHNHSFRRGKPARILKVEAVEVGGEWRPCFKVKYPDGMVDWSPLSDRQNYVVTDDPASISEKP